MIKYDTSTRVFLNWNRYFSIHKSHLCRGAEIPVLSRIAYVYASHSYIDVNIVFGDVIIYYIFTNLFWVVKSMLKCADALHDTFTLHFRDSPRIVNVKSFFSSRKRVKSLFCLRFSKSCLETQWSCELSWAKKWVIEAFPWRHTFLQYWRTIQIQMIWLQAKRRKTWSSRIPYTKKISYQTLKNGIPTDGNFSFLNVRCTFSIFYSFFIAQLHIVSFCRQKKKRIY